MVSTSARKAGDPWFDSRSGHNRFCAFFFYLFCVHIGLRVVLGWAYRGLTGWFLLFQNFSVAISVSPRVYFILVLILISMFLR